MNLAPSSPFPFSRENAEHIVASCSRSQITLITITSSASFVRASVSLSSNGKLLRIKKGDILVFNAGDAHGCTQVSESPFAYDSFTVAAEILDGERFDFPSNTDDLPRKQLEEVFSLLDRCREEDALEAFVAFEQTLVAQARRKPAKSQTRGSGSAPLCAYARASCREDQCWGICEE